jgi:hypothetical protein
MQDRFRAGTAEPGSTWAKGFFKRKTSKINTAFDIGLWWGNLFSALHATAEGLPIFAGPAA